MADPTITSTTSPPQLTAIRRAELSIEELPDWIGATYGQVAGLLDRQHVTPTGPPFASYRMLEPGRFRVEAGFPVATPIVDSGDVYGSSLPGGPVATTVHVGPYDGMEPTYAVLLDWVRAHGAAAGDAWEVYLSDPETEPDPATWRTQIVQPFAPTEPGS